MSDNTIEAAPCAFCGGMPEFHPIYRSNGSVCGMVAYCKGVVDGYEKEARKQANLTRAGMHSFVHGPYNDECHLLVLGKVTMLNPNWLTSPLGEDIRTQTIINDAGETVILSRHVKVFICRNERANYASHRLGMFSRATSTAPITAKEKRNYTIKRAIKEWNIWQRDFNDKKNKIAERKLYSEFEHLRNVACRFCGREDLKMQKSTLGWRLYEVVKITCADSAGVADTFSYKKLKLHKCAQYIKINKETDTLILQPVKS